MWMQMQTCFKVNSGRSPNLKEKSQFSRDIPSMPELITKKRTKYQMSILSSQFHFRKKKKRIQNSVNVDLRVLFSVCSLGCSCVVQSADKAHRLPSPWRIRASRFIPLVQAHCLILPCENHSPELEVG